MAGSARNVDIGPLSPTPLLRMNFESGSCTDDVSGDICVSVNDASEECSVEVLNCPIAGTYSGYIPGGTTNLIKDDAGLAISTPLTLHWRMMWDNIVSSIGAHNHGGLWQDDDTYTCRLEASADTGALLVNAKCNTGTGSSCELSDMVGDWDDRFYDVELYYDTPNDDCRITVGDCTVTCNGSAPGVLVDGWAMGASKMETDIIVDSIGMCAGVVKAGVKCGD